MAPPALEINNLNQEKQSRSAAKSILKNRPLLWALFLYVTGILFSLGLNLGYHLSVSVVILSIIITLYILLKGNIRAAGIAAAIMLFSLGWFRTDLATGPHPANHISRLAEKSGRVTLFGRVVEEPDIRVDRTYLVIEPDSVKIKGYVIPTFGRLRAKVLMGGSLFDHADEVKVDGVLYKPSGARNPGGFDYNRYLQTKNIFAAMSVSGPHNVTILQKGSSFLSMVVKPAREYMISTARQNLSPLSAAILSGFILGERRDIPEEHQTMFKDTGTLHLMAVSGSNVGMVIAVIALPLTFFRIRRKTKVAILLAAVLFFAILTRLEPSVIRASIMAAIGLVAYGWLRKPDYINLIGFAGLTMLIWRPLQLFDVGLQLSFAATFGIVYAIPPIYNYFKSVLPIRGRYIGWIVIIPLSTIAAQAAVMPLMTKYFGKFPLIGIVANIPIGILASFASSFGVALYVIAPLGHWISMLVSVPLELMLKSVNYFLNYFSQISNTVIRTASFSWPEIILYWFCLYFIYEFLVKRRISIKSIIICLILFNIIVWPNIYGKRPAWEIEFIDVGPNRAWIYTRENGENIAGIDIYRSQDDARRILIPYILNYHNGDIKWLVTSTPDSDDIRLLSDMFSPKILRPGDFLRNEHLLNGGGNEKSIRLPEWIKIVWGQSDNNETGNYIFPCLRIEAGNSLILLAGWTSTRVLRGIRENKKIVLLELPWSDYAQSDCMTMINRLNPENVVFSPGRFSMAFPRNKSVLTHTEDRTISTSLYGGFKISEANGETLISSMKPIFFEEH